MRGFARCCLYLAAVSLLGLGLGRWIAGKKIPFTRFPYAPFSFEKQGSIYLKLGIHRWQSKIPDISRILPQIVPPKNLQHVKGPEDLRLMLHETCVAETIHKFTAAAGLLSPLFWSGAGGWILGMVYALGNLPYILVQRYNRPRLMTLYRRMQRRISM